MIQFQVGQKLSTRSIGDHECIFRAEVLKRTAKTLTINDRIDGTFKRCKIHMNNGIEFIYPYGRYSLAPIFKAEVTI